MSNLSKESGHRWIFGTFAVYARSLQTAREVYEQTCAAAWVEPFGVVTTESGEEVVWVNLRSPGFATTWIN